MPIDVICKECPFCGKVNLKFIYIDLVKATIQCLSCGARGPCVKYSTKTERKAKQAWNKRSK